jgi:hypothetical protein
MNVDERLTDRLEPATEMTAESVAMNQQTGQRQQAAQYSPDGKWCWDGQAWRSVRLSSDEQWRWDGLEWVPNRSASPSQSASTFAVATQPLPSLQGGTRVRVGDPVTTGGLAYHFSGDALWSIVFGSASVVLPLLTSFYFPILPVFGLWRGLLAVRRGRVAGGAIGLTVSILGCLASLMASGLLNSMFR